MCVYIPSHAVLFKLMRAAIGVTRPEDLWIYQNPGYKTTSEEEVGRNIDIAGVEDLGEDES